MEGCFETLDLMDARRFFIAVRRLADSFQYGDDRSAYLGSGLEYAQSRPYQWGDPVRSIDWRITARTGRVFVKEYEAPKRMPCYLLLDTSASMTISSTALSKYWVALHVAGGVALACLNQSTPVGVLGVGDLELRIEPSLSRDRVLQWLHRLRSFRYNESTTLGRRIAELGTRMTSRALVIVLSDMHDAAALAALRVIAQRHDCVVLQLRDPAERGLRGAGLLLGREAETGKAFVVRGRRTELDNSQNSGELKRSGIDHLVIDTDLPFAHRLQEFLHRRNVLGRGTR